MAGVDGVLSVPHPCHCTIGAPSSRLGAIYPSDHCFWQGRVQDRLLRFPRPLTEILRHFAQHYVQYLLPFPLVYRFAWYHLRVVGIAHTREEQSGKESVTRTLMFLLLLLVAEDLSEENIVIGA